MKAVSEHRAGFALATALREVWRAGYSFADLRADLLAGITIGIVAVPLSMALAIATGVPPQFGLYTAIVGGVIIALLGGSRLSISGPTAAFVVILHPITLQFGFGGLLLASMLAGLIMFIMGLARFGRLIQFIPYPVTTGFTAGIAVVIASLQFKDLLGLDIGQQSDHFVTRIIEVVKHLLTLHASDTFIGGVTLLIMLLWRRINTRIPSHLVGVLIAGTLAWLLGRWIPGFEVATIASRFSYDSAGQILHGIPALPPLPRLPWAFPGPDGSPLVLSFDLIRALLMPALTIAMLGSIESLLCAVVVDGLSGTKHNPNTELLGQGIGNMIVPLFGGFAATAAIARSGTNVRAGARSPFAAVFHSLFVLLSVVSLAPLMGHLPMASLAALLLIVAWNISEMKHFRNILKVAPASDIVVLLTCFGLTVAIDMVVSVSVGIILAAFLFMQRMADIAQFKTHSTLHPSLKLPLPEDVMVYEIAGPLFFGAAEKAVSSLTRINSGIRFVVLDMAGVPVMDMTGLVALDSIIRTLHARHTCVILSGVQHQPSGLLEKGEIKESPGRLMICTDLAMAVERVRERLVCTA